MSAVFSGKTVLVTGGATGIGRATCVAFANAGAAVLIGDVDDRAAETVAAITAAAAACSMEHTHPPPFKTDRELQT